MTTINLAESQNLPFACPPRLYFLLFAIVALHLSRVLYKSTLFMQNKPNLPDAQMNVTSCITRPYEVLTPRPRRANKPNQTQFQKRHLYCSAKRCSGQAVMLRKRRSVFCQKMRLNSQRFTGRPVI